MLRDTLRRVAGWDWGMIALTLLATLTMVQRQNWVIPKVAFGLTPGELLKVLCAVFWFFAWLSNSPRVLTGRTGVRVGALLVPLAALASFGWVAAQPGSLAFLPQAQGNIFWSVVDALLILFVIDVVRTRAQRGYVVRMLALLGLFSAALVLVESLTGARLADSLRIPLLFEKAPLRESALVRFGLERAAGMANHPLEAGAVIAIVAPICLSLALFSRTSTARMFWWGGFLVMTAAVLSSISRSSIVGLVVGVVVVGLITPTRRVGRIAVVLAAGTGLILVLRPGLAGSLILSVTQAGEDVSIQTRSDTAAQTLSDFAGLRWVFGLAQPGLPPMDNQFLLALTISGLLGVAALAARYLLALNAGAHALAQGHADDTRAEVGGLLAAALVTLVVALALDVSFFDQAWLVTLLVTGLLGAAQAHQELPEPVAAAVADSPPPAR